MLWILLLLTGVFGHPQAGLPRNLNETLAQHLSVFASECVVQEFPNQVPLYMANGSETNARPSELFGSFYGCFDHHSAVHTHWQLLRIARLTENKKLREAHVALLRSQLTAANLAQELAYFEKRPSFERPYGMAWTLYLAAECRSIVLDTSLDVGFRDFAESTLENMWPLVSLIMRSFGEWLPKLQRPIRGGEHSQTAFALSLAYDFTLLFPKGNEEVTQFRRIIHEFVERHHKNARNCPWHFEPSGHDFLSTCLGEAALMTRFLSGDELSFWFRRFLYVPVDVPSADALKWLQPVRVTDKSDGKLAHFDGLNLSRAMQFETLIVALEQTGDDELQEQLAVLRYRFQEHYQAGMAAVLDDMHYMGSHWLGSFAVLLDTQSQVAGTAHPPQFN
ncbi:MAG: hypothetical protein MHM6MM_006071 [Cercozoa sp. M6MM]